MYSLKDIQPYDVGNYTCVTENRAGQVNTTAQLLTVNGKYTATTLVLISLRIQPFYKE